MRRSRIRPMTPAQEAAYDKAERLFTRARIIENGVAQFLNKGDYMNINECGEAAVMLTESIAIRKDAEKMRAERKKEQDANGAPVPAKTRVHHVRRRDK